MSQFLIELPHSEETMACAREVHMLLATGSHFLTHADFGCMDGVHCAWLVVEAASKEEARFGGATVVPAASQDRRIEQVQRGAYRSCPWPT